jgi:hypothetical protein
MNTTEVRTALIGLGVDFQAEFPVFQAARQVANTKFKGLPWNARQYQQWMKDTFQFDVGVEYRAQGEVLLRYLIVILTEQVISGCVDWNVVRSELNIRLLKYESEYPWIRPGYCTTSGEVTPPDEPEEVVINAQCSIQDLPKGVSGKPKKGVKQAMGKQIYEQMTADGKSNKEIVQALVEQLDMTLAGARTYAHNFKTGKW